MGREGSKRFVICEWREEERERQGEWWKERKMMRRRDCHLWMERERYGRSSRERGRREGRKKERERERVIICGWMDGWMEREEKGRDRMNIERGEGSERQRSGEKERRQSIFVDGWRKARGGEREKG